MIKIIFSDFDETMLNYNSGDVYFDDYKISILKKVREKGIKFAIVTGRSIPFFRQFPNLLEVVDYIIASNGGCIYDVCNDCFIYQLAVDNEDFEKIINYTIDNAGGFLLNCLGQRYKFGIWQNTECLEYSFDNKSAYEQIILAFDSHKLKDVIYFIEQFSNISINNISYYQEQCIIDINNKAVSKGNAVVWLCKHLGVDLNDVMAFGDGANDKSMFEVVSKGIAVGNAVDKLKILSKNVALDCNHNGIYKYIEDNILK